MLKGYKTIIFNVIMTIVMIIKMWGVDTDVSESDVHAGLDALEAFLAFIWGIGNLILRAITNTPIFKKEEQPKITVKSKGEISTLLIVILLASAVAFLAALGMQGCSGKSYTQQISEQGGTAIQIATASFIDAEEWYNNAQEAFTRRVKNLPPAAAQDEDIRKAVKDVNDLFNQAGEILDKWRLATTLADMNNSQDAWIDIADQLIDAGLWMFIDEKEELKWR